MAEEQPTQDLGALEGTQDQDASIQSDEAVVDDSQVSDQPTGDATEETGQLSTEDLAQYLGVESTDLDVQDGQVVFKTKVDGQEGVAKLSDFRTSYQLRSHLDNEARENNQLKDQLKAQQTEQQNQYNGKLQQLEDITKIAYEDLTRENQATNWAELKEDDPTEYAVRKADIQERNTNLQQRYQAIQQERLNQQQTSFKDEKAKLYSSIPEWKDNVVAEKEMTELRKYGVKEGFLDSENGDIGDHRAWKLMHKAMKYDQLKSSQPEILKLVKNAPKIGKPGQKTVSKPAQSIEDLFYG